jgi:hypothetical protein
MLSSLGSLIVQAIPDPSPKAPPAIQNKVDLILSFGMYLALAACVGGVLIVGARMALAHRRGEGVENVGGLGWVAFAAMLVISASAVVGWFA